MQQTKMVCTLGPSSCDPDTVRGLIRAGMDVARLNFSHGDHGSHRQFASGTTSRRFGAGSPDDGGGGSSVPPLPPPSPSTPCSSAPASHAAPDGRFPASKSREMIVDRRSPRLIAP